MIKFGTSGWRGIIGEDFTFEYTIPADHPSGTFWYHPHRHGSVAYQLSNGLAGALIVEGSRQDGIADLEDIPEVAAAKERILVIQLYNYRVDPPGKDGVARAPGGGNGESRVVRG